MKTGRIGNGNAIFTVGGIILLIIFQIIVRLV